MIEIWVPLDRVAEYSADPAHAPEWYTNIKSAQWKTEPLVRVGSQIDFVAQFLGRELRYTYEIMEYVPSERIVLRTAQGPFPMETTYTWSGSADGSTLMQLRNRGEPSGFSVLVAPFMRLAVRRANQKDLQKLKEILEAT